MTRDEVKSILQSYRPKDANDPVFQEALRAAADDPELATWFTELQGFDATVAAKLQTVSVPPELESRILLGYSRNKNAASVTPHRPWAWFLGGAIAASLVFGLFLFRPVARPVAAHVMNPLELQAIAYTEKMPALQFICFNASAVATWVNKQPESQRINLRIPEPSHAMWMKMIGSSIVKWDGRPVVMLCLQDGKNMAMLYIMNADAAPDMKDGVTETVVNAGWVVRATKTDGQVRLLAARGNSGNLDFPTLF